MLPLLFRSGYQAGGDFEVHQRGVQSMKADSRFAQQPPELQPRPRSSVSAFDTQSRQGPIYILANITKWTRRDHIFAVVEIRLRRKRI